MENKIKTATMGYIGFRDWGLDGFRALGFEGWGGRAWGLARGNSSLGAM